jgi:Protein of unknown function (DUF3592)
VFAKAIAYFFVTIIVSMGPILLIAAAITTYRQAGYIRTCSSAEGIVLELRVARGKGGRFSYAPLFRFTADDGRSYMLVSRTASNPAGFAVGEHVKVIYQHGDPIHAEIDSLLQLWWLQIVLGVLGAALTVFPVLIFLRRGRALP